MSHTRYGIEAAGEPRKFPPEAMARIEKLLTRYPTKQAALLPVLWVAQETWGWISKESPRRSRGFSACRRRTSTAC